MNERTSTAEGANEMSRAEQANEEAVQVKQRALQVNEQIESEWPSAYVWILGCSGP